MVKTYKLNADISTLNFAHMKAYLLLERPENFSSKQYFLPEILKSKKITHISR
jgi:hypothetical protein